MLFSLVSVSVVCLALAFNGWVPPDPVTTSVKSTELEIYGQVNNNHRYGSIWPTTEIVEWLNFLFSSDDVDVVTEKSCSCRQALDRTSLWVPVSDSVLISDIRGVLNTAIDKLHRDLTHGLHWASKIDLADLFDDKDDDSYDYDDTKNPDVMTSRGILHTPYFFFFLGQCSPFLLYVTMAYFRGKKKKRVNRYRVYSIKDMQKALTRRYKAQNDWFGPGHFNPKFIIIKGKLTVQRKRDLEFETAAAV